MRDFIGTSKEEVKTEQSEGHQGVKIAVSISKERNVLINSVENSRTSVPNWINFEPLNNQ